MGKYKINIEKKIVYLLERISQVFRVLQWELAKERKLTPLQIQILLFLKNREKKYRVASRISDELGLTKATLSESVSALEKKKLIKKLISKDDRRFTTLSLTKSGKKVVKELFSVDDLFERYVHKFNDIEKDNSLRFLVNIISLLYFDGYIRVARICCTCRHFQRATMSGRVYYCNLMSRELKIEDINLKCASYSPVSVKKGGMDLCC